MVELLKRTAGHRGRLHTSLLKSSKFFGVTRAFGYNVEVYRNAETFTRARVCPSPAPYPQDDLVVPDGEVCNVCNFHKAFGFKWASLLNALFILSSRLMWISVAVCAIPVIEK